MKHENVGRNNSGDNDKMRARDGHCNKRHKYDKCPALMTSGHPVVSTPGSSTRSANNNIWSQHLTVSLQCCKSVSLSAEGVTQGVTMSET